METMHQKEGLRDAEAPTTKEKDGAIMVEYALLIAGISLVLMLAILAFSSAIREVFLTVVGLF